MIGVYLVTSGADRRTVEVAAAAARAGAGMIQVRAKDLSARALLELVREVSTAAAEAAGAEASTGSAIGNQSLSPDPRSLSLSKGLAAVHGPAVVVDDSVEVAWTARHMGLPVAGVHLGQDDLPVREARALLGPEAIIGLTTGTLELVQESNDVADVLDYLGAGPFRPTPTKNSGRAPLGLEGYPPLVAATPLPITAIGDIQLPDIEPLAATGVDGVAVVRSVMGAADPEATVREMVDAWNRGVAAR